MLSYHAHAVEVMPAWQESYKRVFGVFFQTNRAASRFGEQSRTRTRTRTQNKDVHCIFLRDVVAVRESLLHEIFDYIDAQSARFLAALCKLEAAPQQEAQQVVARCSEWRCDDMPQHERFADSNHERRCFFLFNRSANERTNERANEQANEQAGKVLTQFELAASSQIVPTSKITCHATINAMLSLPSSKGARCDNVLQEFINTITTLSASIA
jgi:hypothetical protein